MIVKKMCLLNSHSCNVVGLLLIVILLLLDDDSQDKCNTVLSRHYKWWKKIFEILYM